ncbi:MAG: hypothetical protein K5905_02765 [Roseibium sp.]|uniref:hypothetical protein n=1 Tax=Roseibium sp. TaxID=1936156 RepID=UPI002605057D|nr:hypothetical protein [Roseibium sp.]MCV0424369.1 hypothetical protein [Roseibium sp.]
MPRTSLLLALFFLTVTASASDHESVLEARQAGNIASFSKILSAARAAVGERTILVDAKVRKRRSGLQVKVILRRTESDEIVVVTVDAVEASVVDVTHREPTSKPGKREAPKANSRRNVDPSSNKEPDSNRESRGGNSERGNGNRDGDRGRSGDGNGRGDKSGSRK